MIGIRKINLAILAKIGNNFLTIAIAFSTIVTTTCKSPHIMERPDNRFIKAIMVIFPAQIIQLLQRLIARYYETIRRIKFKINYS